MSLVQIQLEDDRAWCAVDTLTTIEGADVNGEQGWEVSKMAAIPHAGSLMVVRGGVLSFSLLLPLAFVDPGARDFDALTKSIPAFVRQLSPSMPPSMVAQLELFVIGWSSASERMEAARFVINLRSGQTKRTEVGRCCIAPCTASPLTPFPHLSNDEAMRAVAQLQLQWIVKHSPADLTGGRLLVAEVTRQEIRMRDAGAISSMS